VIVPTTSRGAPAHVLESGRMALDDRAPHRLPPPPAHPVRSPPIAVAGEVEARVEVRTDAGPRLLEARVHAPGGAERAIVICHPHPLYGGSMHSPVPLAIAKELSDERREDVAWARFDFRGVGASEGSYDEGRGEVDDTRVVIEHMRSAVPGAPVSICGHSFGSWVGLRAAATSPAVDRVLLAAPSVLFLMFKDDALGFAGKKMIFIGSEDPYCDVEEARALAERLGADLRVFNGFDHHFMKSRRAMAKAALPILVPEA
jgi:alpha/beta superfamily hydrolase